MTPITRESQRAIGQQITDEFKRGLFTVSALNRRDEPHNQPGDNGRAAVGMGRVKHRKCFFNKLPS